MEQQKESKWYDNITEDSNEQVIITLSEHFVYIKDVPFRDDFYWTKPKPKEQKDS